MASKNSAAADVYQSPLVARNASAAMAELFSPRRRALEWRRVWLALAEAQHELGLPISAGQLAALRNALNDIDLNNAAAHERRTRHDLMAHLHAFADAAPAARGILHLGATSMDVVDNADLSILREALRLIRAWLLGAIDALADLAKQHADLPCLGYTHYQPAQLTTFGKRASLWCWDFVGDLEEIDRLERGLAFRGIRGATGTQASFLQLLDGSDPSIGGSSTSLGGSARSPGGSAVASGGSARSSRGSAQSSGGSAAKVIKLEQLVARKLGFERVEPVTGQTYSRKIDGRVMAALAGVAASVHKFANDVRLLANLREVAEPFAADQVGSSAMPYKRNPMLTERATGLSRFVIALSQSAWQTAAEQWLERTLDDSSNKRIIVPEAFLAADGMLQIVQHVAGGLVLYPKVMASRVAAELPFLATESILMAATSAGGDRQDLHERLRQHSHAAAREMYEHGRENDLLSRLQTDPAFARTPWSRALDVKQHVGLAPQQTRDFLRDVVGPVRKRFKGVARRAVEIQV